jgi:dolichol kinase
MSREIVHLTSGLYQFMVVGEASLRAPPHSANDAMERLQAHARDLLEAFAAARERASERLGVAVADVCRTLHELVDYLESSAPRRELRRVWKGLGESYEELRRTLSQGRVAIPEGLHLGHVKPRNLWRNAFHVSMGLLGITLYELWLTRGQILAVGLSVLSLFIVLDVTRRLSKVWNRRLVAGIFGKISRPDERHRIPSATWYMLGLVLGVALLPQRAIELGTIALAIGDPAASLGGKRWGRWRLFRDRSIAGSLTFIAATLVVGTIFLALVLPELGPARWLLAASVVAVVGAVTEHFTFGLDDNLTIPLVAGCAATLVLGAF